MEDPLGGRGLEALPVDDGRSSLVVLLLANPHLLEGGERGEDGAADPHGVLPLWRSDDLRGGHLLTQTETFQICFAETSQSYLNLHGAGGQSGDLLLHPVSDTRVHGGAARQHVVRVQVLADIDVALHDAVVRGFVDAGRFHTCANTEQKSVTRTTPTRPDTNVTPRSVAGTGAEADSSADSCALRSANESKSQ